MFRQQRSLTSALSAVVAMASVGVGSVGGCLVAFSNGVDYGRYF